MMDRYKFIPGIDRNNNFRYLDIYKNDIRINGVNDINAVEWFRCEDVKGLEMQVMTLTEQLDKLSRRYDEEKYKIQRLQLKDNDTIVLKSDKPIPDCVIHNVADGVKKAYENKGFSNINVLVLAAGMDIAVLETTP